MSIPSELKNLVFQSVKLLGVAIKDIYGPSLFNDIEKLRLQMKEVRHKEADVVHAALEEVYKKMKKKPDEDLHKIAKAFSLMLEVINACETSYRSFRLKDYNPNLETKPESIIYVFTSHPTEARSKEFLYVTDQVEDLLVKALERGFEEVKEELHYLFQMALRIPLANNKRPEVKDEAEEIFHIIMDERILKEQIAFKKKGMNVFFRTWVGGDKDGHPKVGPKTLLQTLTLSRKKILDFMDKRLASFHQELVVVALDHSKVSDLLVQIRSMSRPLRKIETGDGKKILKLKTLYQKLLELTEKENIHSPVLSDISLLLRLYPALVLPMEIREDSSLIAEALTKKQPIAEMLKLIKKISSGVDPRFYVRGFVISMCQQPQDLLNTINLTIKHLGSYSIPSVPLFENEQGLINGVEILSKTFEKFPMVKLHKEQWSSRLEVMLGYSDSSKENGVLPSRLLVEKALLNLEALLHKHNLRPVFFHGSGGSTGRGGGALKEQISWWPHSALNVYKMTIQGETIQRHFHQAPILRSQVGKLVDEFSKHKDHKLYRPQIADDFATLIQTSYRSLVKDPEFQNMTSLATPYDFLSLLKIGSRPTKRSGKGKFTLRAIPWILCWTQTRLLLPIWWGVGEAWDKLSSSEQIELKAYYKESPLFTSYMRNLGFTLARIEMGVWEFHLSHSSLDEEQKNLWKEKIRKEYDLSVKFFKAVTEVKDFTWFQPRLGESIYFRSSMIHPLNVIQKLSLERNDHVLLRETVTGIACGMLTTG